VVIYFARSIILEVHTSSRATPLLPLVYNMKVVLPVELAVTSIGVLLKSHPV